MSDRHLPRLGDRFEHARMIQGSPKAGTARPDICTVTRVARGQVYYHTETGMKMRQSLERFLADSVGRWLPKQKFRAQANGVNGWVDGALQSERRLAEAEAERMARQYGVETRVIEVTP